MNAMKDICNDCRRNTSLTYDMAVYCCRPQFNASSNDQSTARWPAPGGITETQATATCRSIIVNRNLIGDSCLASIGTETVTTDIVQACVTDVQVMSLRSTDMRQ